MVVIKFDAQIRKPKNTGLMLKEYLVIQLCYFLFP